jgi:hypothetical protein
MKPTEGDAGTRPAPAWREWQARFERSFRAYAARRGFATVNDGPFALRAFVLAWAEPGFHRFWRVWNPGISYFPYRVYLLLGGKDRWVLATLGAFVANGLAHNLLVLPFFRLWWSWTIPVAFLCFGILTVVSRLLGPWLAQERWPTLINVAVNVGLVCLSMNLGFRVDAWL